MGVLTTIYRIAVTKSLFLFCFSFARQLLTIIGATGDEKGVPEAGMASTPKLAIFSGGQGLVSPYTLVCAW